MQDPPLSQGTIPRDTEEEHDDVVIASGSDKSPARHGRANGRRGHYLTYTQQQIEELFRLVIDKQVKIAEAARKVGVNIRTAQRMIKNYGKDEDKRLPTRTNQRRRGPQSALGPEHSEFLKKYLEQNPDAVLVDAVSALKNRFRDVIVSKTTVYNHITNQCQFTLKRAHKDKSKPSDDVILERRRAWALDWQGRTEQLRRKTVFIDLVEFNTHTIGTFEWSKRTRQDDDASDDERGDISVAGAFFHDGVLSVSLHIPRESTISETETSLQTIGGDTTKDHFFSFVKSVLELMKQKDMRGYSIVMDETLVHHAEVVEEWIGAHGYHCAFLPPKSRFLSPADDCWTKIRAKYQRNHLENDETVNQRIHAAAETVEPDDMAAWIEQTIFFIPLCMNKELNF
ncbi:hypothetical protein BGX26_001550 [Mortierella sp. AD094]|nr:hypothetical protein BGX26_001550 [Mortierella sp. AD094]